LIKTGCGDSFAPGIAISEIAVFREQVRVSVESLESRRQSLFDIRPARNALNFVWGNIKHQVDKLEVASTQSSMRGRRIFCGSLLM
jgi:hypothetical protein